MVSMIPVRWLSCSLQDVPEHSEWLLPAERRTADRLRVPKRRNDWRLGRWTAKAALRAAWPSLCDGLPAPKDLAIIAAPDGAPQIASHCLESEAGPPWPTFSLSHSGGVGLCAVAPAEAQVGCDLERLESRSSALIRDFFTEAEQRACGRGSPEQQMLAANLIWSAKESALKALRTGLRADTRSVEVAWEPGGDGLAWSALTVRRKGREPLSGWWRASRGFVLTVVASPRPASPVALASRRASA